MELDSQYQASRRSQVSSAQASEREAQDNLSRNSSLVKIEVIDQPQTGQPMHLHQCEDESSYILEGTFAFQIGDLNLTATPGWLMKIIKRMQIDRLPI
ncbi:hypothetical protein [Chamaesiphon sp. OTE_75_metabat_556]|uniref:hypothetical protein n=1 Tax=Chamaesiphon sp. OTE_75_metabat_556 TaxID=2964692 RepID=UPI00286ABFD0|nr:hypothetical protein [Chamaesiphon sp. OTE_75_metabat_556]